MLTREEYEEIVDRCDVMDEDILMAVRDVLVEERDAGFREIEAILASEPIESPPLEIGMSPIGYYPVDIKITRARRILGVLKRAMAMYGSGAQFSGHPMRSTCAEWQRYCDAKTRPAAPDVAPASTETADCLHEHAAAAS